MYILLYPFLGPSQMPERCDVGHVRVVIYSVYGLSAPGALQPRIITHLQAATAVSI